MVGQIRKITGNEDNRDGRDGRDGTGPYHRIQLSLTQMSRSRIQVRRQTHTWVRPQALTSGVRPRLFLVPGPAHPQGRRSPRRIPAWAGHPARREEFPRTLAV